MKRQQKNWKRFKYTLGRDSYQLVVNQESELYNEQLQGWLLVFFYVDRPFKKKKWDNLLQYKEASIGNIGKESSNIKNMKGKVSHVSVTWRKKGGN